MKWFTSDTHFNHKNIIKYCNRPFNDVEHMNSELLRAINKNVKYGDELYMLGDFAWGKEELSVSRFVEQIKCVHLYLIFGNHDIAPYPAYDNLFKKVSNDLEIKVDGVETILHHYPKAFWNKFHRGSYHLYGHTHAEIEQEMEEKFPGRRSLDVGVDNAYKLLGEFRPFSELEIIEYMRDRPGHAKQYR